ncbi:MAG: hypothetical protein R3237_03520 [Nitrosopumilaceae archaeon]|nr:hypothetical protein [Nitrosopumilaceae archaeon]
MSFRRPRVPKPGIPKIRKPSRLPRKKLEKTIKSEIKKKVTSKTKRKQTSIQKPTHLKTKKIIVKKNGVCYDGKNCKGKIISKKCSKAECKKLGGKSWKGLSGCQEIL